MTRITAAVALVPALLIGVVGGYLTIWGYLGLFMGEPTYRHEATYELMLAGGILALVSSVALIARSLIALISRKSR
jgi:hypothetical protein